MHPFSIDFITACDQEGIKDQGFPSRMTPSPTDSGMGSDQSPSKSGSSNKDTTESLTEAIVALERDGQNKSDDQDKPSHSYIALISMAILSTPEKRMLLSDIYQYIMDNFTYYNNQEKAWRNSIRHNLSLNECFMKNGRADNGKGNYWSIHPACEEDFSRGDFRRRQARRRARRCIKGANYSNMALQYRNNVGYVPMTTSHIGYHPYASTPQASLYYPPSQTFTSLAQPPSATSLPQDTLSGAYSQTSHTSTTSGLFTPSSVYQRQHMACSVPTSATLTAAAQRLLNEQTTAALAAQAFAPQHLSFQNW